MLIARLRPSSPSPLFSPGFAARREMRAGACFAGFSWGFLVTVRLRCRLGRNRSEFLPVGDGRILVLDRGRVTVGDDNQSRFGD